MASKCSFINQGFSLIEVVVATAILTIGIAAVARGFSQCAHAVAVTSDTMRAVRLADNKFEEYNLREAAGKTAEGGPESITTADRFNLVSALEPDLATGLYGLRMNVEWERLHVRRSIVLATYLQ